MFLVMIGIVKNMAKIFKKYKLCFIGLLVILAISDIFYDTYFDETTKKEVICDTEKIKDVIDNECEIVYRNERRLIVFCSEITVREKESVKKIEQYFSSNGYKKQISSSGVTWRKDKRHVYERCNDNGETIFIVRYWKSIYGDSTSKK